MASVENAERRSTPQFKVEVERHLPNLVTSIFLPTNKLLAHELAQEYEMEESRFNERLGTENLYEMNDKNVLVPEVMSINMITTSQTEPDVFVVTETHIGDNHPWRKKGVGRPPWQVANRLRHGLETAGFVVKTEENPLNTFNVTAACSGGVASLLELAGGIVEFDGKRKVVNGRVEDGKRVQLIANETNYRNHLPKEASKDKGKSRLLFSGVAAGLDFEKGEGGMYIYPGMVWYVPDSTGGLSMDIFKEEVDDPYLVHYMVPYAEDFQMNGQAVSRHFTPRLKTESVLEYLDFAGIDPMRVVSLHSHQASRYMIDKVFSQFPEDVFPRLKYRGDVIKKYGNISSASSLATTVEMFRDEEFEFGPEDVHLWINFGAGYVHGFGAVRFFC